MSEARRVSDVMTRSVVSVRPETRIADARWIACVKGIRHLPVVSREVVGIVCLCDLEGQADEAPVSAVMHAPVRTIPAGASLHGAAIAMRRHDIGCLPVVRDTFLLGIVTRGDLSRAGLSTDEVFGDRICAACGCHHEIAIRDPIEAVVAFCRECLERAKSVEPDEELGVGD